MKPRQLFKTLVAFTALSGATPVWSLEIQSPRPGESVSPGQTVWLIVSPSSPAEADIDAVQISAPGANGCQNLPAAVPFQCALTIADGADDSTTPNAIDIRVQVSLSDGTTALAATHLAVAEAVSVQALQGDPRTFPLIFDSIGEQRDLPVFGVTADGATHDLRGRAHGTAYEISDPAVVAVRADGRVVSKHPGTATITVRNGSFTFDVPAVVREPANTKTKR